MRLDHLLSKEEVGAVLLFRCEGGCPAASDISGGRYEGVTPPEEKTFPVAIRLGGTPVPIPNTKVKTQTADGTMLETAWESRRLPEPKGA